MNLSFIQNVKNYLTKIENLCKIVSEILMEAPNMEYDRQIYSLKGLSNRGEIKLAVNVRCLKKAKVTKGLGGLRERLSEPKPTSPEKEIPENPEVQNAPEASQVHQYIRFFGNEFSISRF